MIVMKFGGTSVMDSEAVERLIRIVSSNKSQKRVVVVSALAGVTDTLIKVARHAAEGQAGKPVNLPEAAEGKHLDSTDEASVLISGLEHRHLLMAEELLAGNDVLLREATDTVKQLFTKLNEIVRVISVLEELSDMSMARILSYGEMLSSSIIYKAMLKSGLRCAFADARSMIVTDGKHLKGEPQTDIICRKVPELLEREFLNNDVVITQGFISATSEGIGTTLGRGGSDYSAALIGMAANATEIQIWTDVDGVHTTDPRKVSKTRSISVMSFSEAAELSFFGAKVLHPATIQPAVEKNIPVRVLNSKQPDRPGTLILKDDEVHENGVRAISFKENITVINIFSMKMLNAFGFLTRLFEVFGKYGISVDLISTSEVNVSLTVDSESNLDDIVADLSKFAVVSVSREKSQVSDKGLLQLAGDVADKLGIKVRKGVYIFLQGPAYETPAEIKMLEMFGADAVGMSTVPEVTVAVHCGMKVLGISCITNSATTEHKTPLSHEEVLATAKSVEKTFTDYIGAIVSAMEAQGSCRQ